MAKKIVIAEDEKSLRKALALKLAYDGYEVVEVADGKAALEALKSGADLLLLDIMMPVLDGFSVLEAIKKDGAKYPIIVTTNLSQEEDEKKALAMGATAYVVKSDLALDAIVSLIAKHI